MTPATIIFGGGAIGGLLKDYTTEGGKELLTILKENGVKEIDTAKAYVCPNKVQPRIINRKLMKIAQFGERAR